MPRAPLVVDPVSFAAASAVVGRVGHRLSSSFGAGVDQPGMAGDDPVGRDWGAAYDGAAGQVVTAGEAVTNGCFRLAGLLEQAGFNYSIAEDASTSPAVTRRIADTTPWAAIGCSLARPGPAAGAGTTAPGGWSLISDLVGRAWPNGHQDRLLVAGRAWARSAEIVRESAAATWTADASLLSVSSPDTPAATAATQALRAHLSDVAAAQQQLGDACTAYAHHLDTAHAAIVDELESLVWWTAGIEAAGLLGSIFSFGLAEAPTQAVEGGRIAVTAARVATVIGSLADAVATVRVGLAAASARVAGTIEGLGPLLRAEPAVAGVIVVRASEIGRITSVAARAEVDAQRALSMAAVRRSEAAGLDAALAGDGDPARLQALMQHFAAHRGRWSVPGRYTREQADEMGRAWVGPGARWSNNGRALMSRDGLRQYRPAQWKNRAQRWRANLEARPQPTGDFIHNGHIEIKDR